ncbi:CBR-WRK-1 protein [Aphelenchoides avenae]|nr:CBR-WRK-1 protein [Aphelenchus avenae]
MRGVFTALLAIAVVDAAVRITTPPRKFEVRVGDSVDLPCNVDGLNKEENVVVWMRGDKMLSMDSEVEVSEDPRFSINVENDNYTLTISSLEPFDTADYECSVSVHPKVLVTHKVQVIVPPSVKITGETTMLVQVGEDVHVKCSATTGNPAPRITWRRLEGRMPADASHSHHGTLHIRRAQVADSGFYECVGSNGVPPGDTARVEIKVQANGDDDDTTANESKPWVTTDHTYIPVRLDEDVNITCKYDGVPSPITDWLYNNFPIARVL